MFDGETTGIDDAFPAAGGQTEYDEYTPDGSDYTYISSHSRWQSWADFDRVVHALFTDTFWSACNDDGNAPIYIEHDGRLFILDCAYGDQYYNSNIPDAFALISRTDNRIDFTVTAHYSYPYPRWDETYDERDKRLETSYEYTRTYIDSWSSEGTYRAIASGQHSVTRGKSYTLKLNYSVNGVAQPEQSVTKKCQ